MKENTTEGDRSPAPPQSITSYIQQSNNRTAAALFQQNAQSMCRIKFTRKTHQPSVALDLQTHFTQLHQNLLLQLANEMQLFSGPKNS